MKNSCHKCRGSGRVRIQPIDPLEAILLLGIPFVIRSLVEHDRDDD